MIGGNVKYCQKKDKERNSLRLRDGVTTLNQMVREGFFEEDFFKQRQRDK